MSAEKTCMQGDDSTCLTYFGALASKYTTCCWKATLIGVPAYGGDVTQSTINEYKAALSSHGLPSNLDETTFTCKNNWIDLYPNSTIPVDYEYTDAAQFTWRSSCSKAQNIIASGVFVATSVFMSSY